MCLKASRQLPPLHIVSTEYTPLRGSLTRRLRPLPTQVLKFSEIRPLQGARNRGERDVTTKISGYQNRPVQVGTGKSVSRTGDAQKSSAESAGSASPVRITDQAKQLAALEQAVQTLPIVDEARVAAIRLAIERGEYEVSPERIATKLLQVESELAGEEK
jgi:negative regulator of flagellin synthesis FlgM